MGGKRLGRGVKRGVGLPHQDVKENCLPRARLRIIFDTPLHARQPLCSAPFSLENTTTHNAALPAVLEGARAE